jgi:predicted membrane protein
MMGNMSGNKWATWVTMGSILMMVAGGFKLIAGIIGLFQDQYLVQGANGYQLVDATGLAIWWLIVGAILLFGGMAALSGKSWGYVVGILAAALAAFSEFFSIPYTPIWSIIMIVIYIAVLAAFINAPARK